MLSGHREIAALWLPDEWYDEATRRRLALAAWRTGATLLRFDGGDLLRFAAPVVDRVEALPGWPLQRVSGTLCSADVAPQQLADRGHADVLLAIGAEWRALNLADARPLDASLWLDIAIGFVDMTDCRLPPAERVVVEPPTRALRDVLGPGVPGAPSSETTGLLRALALRRQRDEGVAGTASSDVRSGPTHQGFRSDTGGTSMRLAALVAVLILAISIVALLGSDPQSGSGVGGGPDGSGNTGATLAALVAFGFILFAFVRGAGGRSAGGKAPGAGGASPRAGAPKGQGTGASAGKPAGAPREGLLARARRALRELPARATGKVAPQRWRAWAARLAMTTGIAQLLGAQHSAYLQRMLKMFDDGHLDDALRHAIPLGGDHESLGQSFGRLGPRDRLALQSQRGASTSIGLGNDLEQHLRGLYRRTFEQLDRAGRIDEAVFVLAELLNARQEALDYLEKHGRFTQAAELALGWDMPAAQIVRLHALAGDWRVAVLVARRDNAFEAAIALLEPRWPEAALQLRKEWADSLVARGQWLAAVRTVWRIESERGRAAEWLQHAEDGGGAMAARALALRAQCLPQTLATRADLIAALCDDPTLAEERAALARELLQLPTPIEATARRLASMVCGPLLADPPELGAQMLRQLVTLAADPVLSADLPAAGWPDIARKPLAQHQGTAGWFAPEAGVHAIVDVVALKDGEFLIALGEAGAVRVDARGRWRARFAVPAHQLVIADDRGTALALARRERVWRVSRLDLARGQSQDLGMHEFDAVARNFDGIGWSVGIGRRVQVLDTTRGLSEILWHAADLPGHVVALDVFSDTETWVMRDGDALHQWSYALPSRRLRERSELPPADPSRGTRLLAGRHGVLEFSLDTPYDATAHVRPLAGGHTAWKPVPWHGADALIAAAGPWLALREPIAADATEQAIVLVNIMSGHIHGRWIWPRDAKVNVRHDGATWLAFDDQGRVCAINTDSGEVRALSVR